MHYLAERSCFGWPRPPRPIISRSGGLAWISILLKLKLSASPSARYLIPWSGHQFRCGNWRNSCGLNALLSGSRILSRPQTSWLRLRQLGYRFQAQLLVALPLSPGTTSRILARLPPAPPLRRRTLSSLGILILAVPTGATQGSSHDSPFLGMWHLDLGSVSLLPLLRGLCTTGVS